MQKQELQKQPGRCCSQHGPVVFLHQEACKLQWLHDAAIARSAIGRVHMHSTAESPALILMCAAAAAAATTTAAAAAACPHPQCKPQCDVIVAKTCLNLSIPACSVTGCAWCAVNNSGVCTRCKAGFSLNLATKKCDCAPGYHSVQDAAGKTFCSQCTGNTISYGGKLPTANCSTCPVGRVANLAHTECVGELADWLFKNTFCQAGGLAGWAGRVTGWLNARRAMCWLTEQLCCMFHLSD